MTTKTDEAAIPIIRRKVLEQAIAELLTEPSPALLEDKILKEYGAQLHQLREQGYAAHDVAQRYIERLDGASVRLKKKIVQIFERLFNDLDNGVWRPVSTAPKDTKKQPGSAGEADAARRDAEAEAQTRVTEGDAKSGDTKEPDDGFLDLETIEAQLRHRSQQRDDSADALPSAGQDGAR